MRVALARKLKIFIEPASPETVFDNGSVFGITMACVALALISLDTYVGWVEGYFLAVTEDDQIAVVTVLFLTIAYFMGCAGAFHFLPDVSAMIRVEAKHLMRVHLFIAAASFLYWLSLPIDDWNPVLCYMPDFYYYSYLLFPWLIWTHMLFTFHNFYAHHQLAANSEFRNGLGISV